MSASVAPTAGIDISKDQLDVAIHPDGATRRFANDRKGHAAMLRWLEPMTVMPGDAAKLVGEQLMNVVRTSGSKKGFGLMLALALFGARSAAGAIVTAFNIAYEEKEKRGFIFVNLLVLGIIAAGVLVALLAVVAIAALGHLEVLLPTAPDFVLGAGKPANLSPMSPWRLLARREQRRFTVTDPHERSRAGVTYAGLGAGSDLMGRADTRVRRLCR